MQVHTHARRGIIPDMAGLTGRGGGNTLRPPRKRDTQYRLVAQG